VQYKHECLLVGGSHDGRRIRWSLLRTLFMPTKREPVELLPKRRQPIDEGSNVEAYRPTLISGDTMEHGVLAFESLTVDDVIQRLIAGYNPHKDPGGT